MFKFTTYEDIKNQSTEDYFNNNQFSIDAFNKKYRIDDKETYVKSLKRVCDFIASVEETEEKRQYWSARWFHEIYNDWWHPAGSIMQGAGSNRNISASNCTTISLGVNDTNRNWDNLESIFKNTAYTVAKCAAFRQGLGVDFSRLRPKNTKVYNSANESTGAIHWMKFIDSIGYYVGQKGRIPAMLFSLNCSHPDVEEFITCKADYTKIQNANISVQCTDAFYEAVEKDKEWELSFEIPEVKKGQKVYVDVHSIDRDILKDNKGFYYIARQNRPYEKFTKKVSARKLLELIAKHMTLNAEPGIQNIDIARKYSNSDYLYDPNEEYDTRIISSNAPVVGDTLIPTVFGIKPIKELFEKETVEVIADTITTLPANLIDHNNLKTTYGKYNFPTKTIPVTATFKKYEKQQVYEIHLNNGCVLKCNSEHKWLINGEMTKTIDIKIGDKLFKPNGGIYQSYDLKTDFNAPHFQLGDLVGYIVGDGWIGKASNLHNKMIGIVYDSDCTHYSESFRKLYNKITGKNLSGERDRGKINEIRTEQVDFVKFFEQFGLINNKYIIPTQCYTDKEFCAGFLRGLFQADSHVRWNGKQGYINLTTVSPEISNGVRDLLSNWFGIHVTITKTKGVGVKYGNNKISNAKDKYDVRIAIRNHMIRFRDLIGLIGSKGEKLKLIHNNCQQYNNRISSIVQNVIKTDKYEDMYCAVVPGLQSFVVNGYISSNCSEQYLSRESLCVLASINAGKFSIVEEEYKKELETIGESVNRFLDNVNECELRYGTYATPHQKLAIQQLRRTGAGYTNLVEWLFNQNEAYGSKEGNDKVENFTKWYNYYLYKSSIALGKEKGNFGAFNREKLEKSPFIQRMIGMGLKFTHLRNVTCSSIAPTGCIEQNTRIKTNRGLIKIKDLVKQIPTEKCYVEINDNLYTQDEFKPVEIISLYNNGKVNGYSLFLDDGRKIKISDTHRVRVFNENGYVWKYAPELQLNDILVSSIENDLDNLDYIQLNTDKTSKHYNNNNCKLPIILDEKLAKLIGLFTGNGSIHFKHREKSAESIRIAINAKDKDLVDQIRLLVKELFDLSVSVETLHGGNMYSVNIHSKNVTQFFLNNNFSKYMTAAVNGDGTRNNRVYNIPEVIFRSPKTVIAAYLSGYFETDGCISNDYISLTSKHKHIIEEIQELLWHLGMQSKIRCLDRTEDPRSFNDFMYEIKLRYKRDKIRFRETVGFLSDRKNTLLKFAKYQQDKEKIYLSYKECVKIRTEIAKILSSNSKLYQRLNVSMQNNVSSGFVYLNRDLINDISEYTEINLPFEKDQLVTSTIIEIKREEMETLDIEVADDNHTYLSANGIINHNSLTLMFRYLLMSYGIEPAFDLYFWKRTRISGRYEYYFCVPNAVRRVFAKHGINLPINSDTVKDTWDGKIGRAVAKIIDENKVKLNLNFQKSTEVTCMDKLDLMAKAMKWIDSSISVTYLLPENANWKDVYDFILEANKREVKSIAAFPDKKMYGIVSFVPFKDLAFKLTAEGVDIHAQNFTDEELKELNISRENINVQNNAPKRLKSLSCDLHYITHNNENYLVVIGIQNGVPYEVFGGHIRSNSKLLQDKPKQGTIIRNGQANYSLELPNQRIDHFGSTFTPFEQTIFRLASTMMRHGVPIQYVVEQLSKAAQDIHSIENIIARVLKKYIKDGQKISGKECPSCKSTDLVYQEGCVTCSKCNWSKCS